MCVCVFVQAFPGIAPERLVRSGAGWHRRTRRNAGTTVVPVAGRSAARGKWHVPPRDIKVFESMIRCHFDFFSKISTDILLGRPSILAEETLLFTDV